MKRLSVVAALLFCALLLTACPNQYLPAVPLPISDLSFQSTDNSQLAIAVDASGAQHIARAECSTSTGKSCRIVYEKLVLGVNRVLYSFLPSSGYLFRNPDIAVTDSGIAYVTWQNCPEDDSNTRLCSTWLMSSSDYTMHVLETATYSLSAPLVVARGETVYAVHEVTNGNTGGVLRYCQVSSYFYTCAYVSAHPDPATDTVRRMDAAAAVSTAGALYVTWLEQGIAAESNAYYNDNYGLVDYDMAHQLMLGPYVRHFPPAIAVETDDTWVYTLVTTDNTPGSGSDGMAFYYCNPANCSGNGNMTAVNMDVAKSWRVYDTPSLTAGSAWALVGFSAENSDITGTEIFWSTHAGNASAPTPSVPFSTPGASGSDCDPVVALVSSMQSIGWHMCGFPPSRGDVYFYSLGSGPDGVIHSPASAFAGRGGLAMASNGEFVAGIWNELQDDGRIATWLAYNSYLNYLPYMHK